MRPSTLIVCALVLMLGSGCSLSSPSPTQVPSATPIPTSTLPPPTPTPAFAGQSALTTFVVDPVVRAIDPFDGTLAQSWEALNPETNAEVLSGTTVLQGAPAWGSGIGRRREFSPGEGVGVLLTYPEENQVEFFFDRGQWDTDDYRRFGIYLWDSPTANVWSGRQRIGFQSLPGNFRPMPDARYLLIMSVGQGGEFLAVLTDPADPSRFILYRQVLGSGWADLAWRFNVQANEASGITLDELAEFSFATFK